MSTNNEHPDAVSQLNLCHATVSRRRHSSRLQLFVIAFVALVFPCVLWALPPNNRGACDLASEVSESVGANSAALYFARFARKQPGGGHYTCVNAEWEDDAERDANLERLERKLSR